MSPRTARIIALATDLRRPLAAVAALCGVSRQHVHRLIRARAIRLHRMRLAARAPDTGMCEREGCGREIRVTPMTPRRYCSPECWYAAPPPERPESVGGRAYAARLDGHPWATAAELAGSVSAHAAKLAAKDYARRRGLEWPAKKRC